MTQLIQLDKLEHEWFQELPSDTKDRVIKVLNQSNCECGASSYINTNTLEIGYGCAKTWMAEGQ